MEKEGTTLKTLDKFHIMSWTKKKKWALVFVTVTLVFVLFLLIKQSNSDGSEAIVIQSQNYEEKIVAAGQLQLANETTLVSEVEGEIQFIGAEEGDTISAGAIIISIDDSDQSFQLEQKKAGYEEADAQYRNLVEFEYAAAKENLKSLTIEKDRALKAYEAAVKLYDEGAMAQIDMIESQSEYEAALSDYKTAMLKLQSLSEGGSLRSSAYSKLENAKSIYDSALTVKGKYQITVPWESLVLKSYVSVNDNVRSGDPLAEIGEAGSYHVVTDLDEKYFPYLSKGMKAVISLGDSGKMGHTEGSISLITPKIDNSTGTFKVEIELPEQFSYQASDLTVNVEILLKKIENGIVIPENYLIGKDSSVYLYKNGKAVKAGIKYEMGPSSSLLITDGLKNGDIIIKPSPEVENGMAVKIVKGDDAS